MPAKILRYRSRSITRRGQSSRSLRLAEIAPNESGICKLWKVYSCEKVKSMSACFWRLIVDCQFGYCKAFATNANRKWHYIYEYKEYIQLLCVIVHYFEQSIVAGHYSDYFVTLAMPHLALDSEFFKIWPFYWRRTTRRLRQLLAGRLRLPVKALIPIRTRNKVMVTVLLAQVRFACFQISAGLAWRFEEYSVMIKSRICNVRETYNNWIYLLVYWDFLGFAYGWMRL